MVHAPFGGLIVMPFGCLADTYTSCLQLDHVVRAVTWASGRGTVNVVVNAPTGILANGTPVTWFQSFGKGMLHWVYCVSVSLTAGCVRNCVIRRRSWFRVPGPLHRRGGGG